MQHYFHFRAIFFATVLQIPIWNFYYFCGQEMKINAFIISMLLSALVPAAVTNAQERDNPLKDKHITSLADSAQTFIDRGDTTGLTAAIAGLREFDLDRKSVYAEFYADYYEGNLHYIARRYDQAFRYLTKAKKSAETFRDYRLLALVDDDMGIYYLDAESNYNKALSLFYEGLEAAGKAGFDEQSALILAHIAGTMFISGDNGGLDYATDCYDLSHKIGDPILIYMGAYYSACLEFRLDRLDEAESHIKEAIFLNDANHIDSYAGLYSVYANVLLKKGKEREADEYYKKALANISPDATFSAIYTYLSLGTMEYTRKNYAKAGDYLLDGIKVCDLRSCNYFRPSLYLVLSQSCSAEGDDSRAYDFLKMYSRLTYDLFTSKDAAYIKEMKVKYDTQKAHAEAAEAKEALLSKQHTVIIVSAALAFALLVALFIFILYRRKSENYRALAKQILEKNNSKYKKSSLSEDKSKELFSKVEKVMRGDRKFNDPDMTMDRLAEAIGSNRTYVSRVINENTSLTYNGYVNSIRVDEAVHILSQDACSTSMKALAIDLGFTSLSSFYKSFHDINGMSPTEFRNQVVELASSKKL